MQSCKSTMLVPLQEHATNCCAASAHQGINGPDGARARPDSRSSSRSVHSSVPPSGPSSNSSLRLETASASRQATVSTTTTPA